MVLAASDLAGVLASGVAANEITKGIDHTKSHGDEEPHLTLEHLLRDIHATILQMQDFMHKQLMPAESNDLYKLVQVWKSGLGRTWIPSQEGRMYTRILSAADQPLYVDSIIGKFIYTTGHGTWEPFDMPDQTVVILDASATVQSVYFWIRYTNVAP